MTRRELISALVTITTAERLRREKARELGRVKATGCSESVPRYDAPEVSFPQALPLVRRATWASRAWAANEEAGCYSRVEPRQGDLPADYIIPARTLLVWAVVCLAFWGPVVVVVWMVIG